MHSRQGCRPPVDSDGENFLPDPFEAVSRPSVQPQRGSTRALSPPPPALSPPPPASVLAGNSSPHWTSSEPVRLPSIAHFDKTNTMMHSRQGCRPPIDSNGENFLPDPFEAVSRPSVQPQRGSTPVLSPQPPALSPPPPASVLAGNSSAQISSEPVRLPSVREGFRYLYWPDLPGNTSVPPIREEFSGIEWPEYPLNPF